MENSVFLLTGAYLLILGGLFAIFFMAVVIYQLSRMHKTMKKLLDFQMAIKSDLEEIKLNIKK